MRLRASLILLLIVFLVQAAPAQAQRQTLRPDLVLEELVVDATARKILADGTLAFPFAVVVRNIGHAAAVEAVAVAAQTRDARSGQWQGSGNCWKISPLPAGTARRLSGEIRLKAGLGRPSWQLRAFVDSACDQTNAPAWGQVRENNESNNASNEVSLSCPLHTKRLTWVELNRYWQKFRRGVILKISAWDDRLQAPRQDSSLTVFGNSVPLAIGDIRLGQSGLGEFRFLVQNMYAIPEEMKLIRANCAANQVRLEIPFESDGVEVKGLFRSLLNSNWRDDKASDLEVNGARWQVALEFFFRSGRLDFAIDSEFSTDIQVAGSAASSFNNMLLRSWRTEICRQISVAITESLKSEAEKADFGGQVLNWFLEYLGEKGTVCNLEFSSDAVLLTYW
jgi:hypothetical protein